MSSIPQSSIPLEMSELDNSEGKRAGSQGLSDEQPIPSTTPTTSDLSAVAGSSGMASENTRPAESSENGVSTREPQSDALPAWNDEEATSGSTGAAANPSSSNPIPITRLDSVAIGPSTDTPASHLHVASDVGPVLVITLLLTSGARHPYKIDEKYLTKRNVSVPGVTEDGKRDPYSISVYTLKELILREWREEWEAQPNSPSSIRLIFFGRLLDDKTALKGIITSFLVAF